MTTEQTWKAAWAITLVILLVTGVKGRADGVSVLLNSIDIQTLRYLQQQRNPPVLKSLSKVGWETLFSGRGLDIESALVERSGLWRWRGPHDTTLNAGEMGAATDADLLHALLNGTAGPVPGTQIVIPLWVPHGISFYNQVATIRLQQQGGSRQFIADHYELMLDAGKILWESPDSPTDKKDDDRRLIGELLRNVPRGDVDRLFTTKKKKALANACLDQCRQEERKVPSYFSDAQTADPASVSQIILPSILDAEKHQLIFPVPAKRIDSPVPIYALPLDPPKKLWIKVRPDVGPESAELERANAAKLLTWMKDGKVEMFLQNNDVPLKVLPHQWESHIHIMESRLAPKK